MKTINAKFSLIVKYLVIMLLLSKQDKKICIKIQRDQFI